MPDIDELEVGLVDERGGLQGMSDALVAHLAPGDTAQLRVDQRDELLESHFVAVPPREEQVGHLSR